MELKAQKRTQLGRSVNALRTQGVIPAELYGKGINNEHLALNGKEFAQVFAQAGESTMIDLMIDSVKHPVLIQDVQRHYLSDDIIAVDLYQPRLDELITVHIPLNFIGESPAVKDKDGVLVKSVTELEVETLPTNIPHDFEVDLSQIQDIGQSIQVKDLKIPEGVEVLADMETALATVTEKISEEEDQAMGQEADLGAIASEAETEKKDPEEGEKTEVAPEEEKSE
ncbi:MAG: 50S ribosomal protein L25 [Candidatus Harrisonbacteria bacterium]|nr:50S ribosomal protein L25 [Candidatus Harrisonbacteria bacterium]